MDQIVSDAANTDRMRQDILSTLLLSVQSVATEEDYLLWPSARLCFVSSGRARYPPRTFDLSRNI